MAKFSIFTEDEITTFLESHSDWSIKDGKLTAIFTFKTFIDAIAVVNEVATESERVNHHPEWCNTYNKLSFSFCTHDAGNKITNLDIEMAKFISIVAKKYI